MFYYNKMILFSFKWIVFLIMCIQTGASEPEWDSISCTFQDSLCKWKVVHGQHSFERSGDYEQLLGPQSPPLHKRSYLQMYGIYYNSPQLQLELESSSDVDVCFSFQTFAFTSNFESKLTLSAQKRKSGSRDILWAQRYLTVDQWTQSYTVFRSSIYKSLTLTSTHPLAAFSDFRFTQGPCEQPPQIPNLCNFEYNSFCGWQDASPSQFELQLVEVVRKLQYPVQDATLRSNYAGHYLIGKETEKETRSESKSALIQSNHLDNNHQIAVLLSTLMKVKESQHFCLRFQMFRSLAQSEVLSVHLKNNAKKDLERSLWSSRFIPHKEKMNNWQRIQIGFQNSFDFHVVLVLKRHPQDIGRISIDDLELLTKRCSNHIDCSFKEEFCGYTQPFLNSDINKLFLIGKGRLQNEEQIKDFGDLANFNNGPFLYADFSTDPIQKVKWARSPAPVHITSQWTSQSMVSKFCIRFSFSIHSTQSNQVQLRLSLETEHNMRELFVYDQESTNGWQSVEVPCQEENVYRLIFMAHRITYGAPAAVAIANVTRELLGCNHHEKTSNTEDIPHISCDFLVDLCGWKNEIKDGWSLEKSEIGKNDNSANMIIFNPKKQVKPKDKKEKQALLRSPRYESEEPDQLHVFCFQIEYYAASSDNFLEVYLNNDRVLVKESSSTYEAEWSHRQITFTCRGDFHFYLLAKASIASTAVSRIKLQNGHCDDSPHLRTCDFEQSGCGFYPFSGEPAFELISAKELILKGKKEQIMDHSLDSGNGRCWAVQFLLNRPQQTVRESVLWMFDQKVEEEVICLNIWLSVNAPVSVHVYENSHRHFELKDLQPDPQWYPYQIELLTFDKTLNLQMSVVYEKQKEFEGFVALDDVSVRPGRCIHSLFDCDFEKKCFWQNLRQGELTDIEIPWTKSNMKIEDTTQFLEISARIEPPFTDHTTETSDGKFLYFSGSGKAVLRSPKLMLEEHDIEKLLCLKFWYAFNAPDALTSNLHFAVGLDNQAKVIMIRQLKLINTKDWTEQHVEIQVSALITETLLEFTKRALVFYLIADSNIENHQLAIDDLQLLQNQCPSDKDQNSWFQCEDNKKRLVPIEDRCNGVRNCPDASDEKNCGECLMENGRLCRYHLHGGPDAWHVVSKSFKGNQMVNGNFLDSHIRYQLIDEGLQSNFLYTDLRAESVAHCVSITSPIIRNSAHACTFKFLEANQGTKISLHLLTGNSLENALQEFSGQIHEIDSRVTADERVIWRTNGMNPKPLHQEVFLGKLRQPTRLQFRVCKMQSYIGIWQAMLSHFEKMNCNEFDLKYSNCPQNLFDCGNNQCISNELVCDQSCDCDTGVDESNCEFDQMGLDFEKAIPSLHHLKGFKHILTNQQSDILNIRHDHSKKTPIGGLIWLSSVTIVEQPPRGTVPIRLNQEPLQPKPTLIKGSLTGFNLINQPGCIMRLFIAIKEKCSATIQLLTKDGLYRSQKILIQQMEVFSLKDKWQQLVLPIHSNQLRKHIRVDLHVELSKTESALLLDDISFTRACYAEPVEALKSIENSEPSTEKRSGLWNLVFMQSSLQIGPAFYLKPLISTINIQGAKEYQLKKVNMLSSKPKDKIYETIFQNSFVQTIQKSRNFKLSFVNQTQMTDFKLKTCDAIFESPLIQIDQNNRKFLHFEFAIIGNGWTWLQLYEKGSNEIIFEQNKFDQGNTRVVQIPLPLLEEDTLELQMFVQQEHGDNQLLIKKLEIKTQHPGLTSKLVEVQPCDFSESLVCKNFFHFLLPKAAFLYSKDYAIKTPDHTLGSSVSGGFLFAGCSFSKHIRKQVIRFADQAIYGPTFAITFWFTSFWLNQNMEADIEQERSKTGGKLQLLDVTDSSRILFDSQTNLNGQWIRASIVIHPFTAQQLRLVASLDSANSNYCIAIDDVKAESIMANKEQEVTCNFEKGSFCGWSNDPAVDLINWVQAADLTDDQNSDYIEVTNGFIRSTFTPDHSDRLTILRSPALMIVKGGQCLTFLNRISDQLSSLHLWVMVENEQNNRIPLLQMTSLTTTWNTVKAQIPEDNKAQQIVVLALLVGDNESKINASVSVDIDDFHLHLVDCSEQQTAKTNWDQSGLDILEKKGIKMNLPVTSARKLVSSSITKSSGRPMLRNALCGGILILLSFAVAYLVMYRKEVTVKIQSLVNKRTNSLFVTIPKEQEMQSISKSKPINS